MALPVGMVCKQLAVRAANAWPTGPVVMARGLRIAACEFPSWKWKTAGVSCSSSGRGLHARDGGELIPGIETSCDDTGAAVVMPRFLSLCLTALALRMFLENI